MAMIMSYTRLYHLLDCICVFWLIGNSWVLATDKDESCDVSNGKTVSFYSCPRNCSQNYDGYYFNCSVGGLDDLKKYEYNLDPKNKFLPDLLDPPTLLDIKYQYQMVQKGHGGDLVRDLTGAISVTFRLPKAKEGNYPEAVQLHFQGITKGDYYTTCPRQRIFVFHNYKPTDNSEGLYPRNISYTCFYGVDDQPQNDHKHHLEKFKKGYFLGLKSRPGKWINYTVTINVISPVIPLNQWIPTIAVSLNVSGKCLLVLAEKEPSSIQVIYTEMFLYTQGGDLLKIVHAKAQDRTCTFCGLIKEVYVVKVVINGMYNGTQQNWRGETVEINALAIPEEDPTMEPLKIFSMVGGCLIGMTLLCVLGIVVYRQRYCRKMIPTSRLQRGIILHPFDEPRHSEFIDQFEKLVEKNCSCNLLPWKPLQSKSISETKRWLESDFKSLSYILVFYDGSCYDNDPYSCVLKNAVERKTQSNFRLIPVQLLSIYYLPSVIRHESYVKWDDLEQIYLRIHGVNEIPQSLRNMLKGQWKQTIYGQALINMFKSLSTDSVITSYVDMTVDLEMPNYEGISETNEKIKEQVTLEDDDPHELVTPSEMKEFVKLTNLENDSVINAPCRKDFNQETSIQSIQADVHSDSFKSAESNEPDINPIPSPATGRKCADVTDNHDSINVKHSIESQIEDLSISGMKSPVHGPDKGFNGKSPTAIRRHQATQQPMIDGNVIYCSPSTPRRPQNTQPMVSHTTDDGLRRDQNVNGLSPPAFRTHHNTAHERVVGVRRDGITQSSVPGHDMSHGVRWQRGCESSHMANREPHDSMHDDARYQHHMADPRDLVDRPFHQTTARSRPRSGHRDPKGYGLHQVTHMNQQPKHQCPNFPNRAYEEEIQYSDNSDMEHETSPLMDSEYYDDTCYHDTRWQEHCHRHNTDGSADHCLPLLGHKMHMHQMGHDQFHIPNNNQIPRRVTMNQDLQSFSSQVPMPPCFECSCLNGNHLNQMHVHRNQHPHIDAEIPSESCPLNSREEQNHHGFMGNPLVFRAVDPRPMEREPRVQSNQRHFQHIPPFIPPDTDYGSNDDIELDNLKSVSQEALSVTDCNEANEFVTQMYHPPIYNMSSQESITSRDQVEQLEKINREALQ